MRAKKLFYKFLLALVLAGFMPGPGAQAQQYEKSRKLTKEFPISEETDVQIINKYGNIHILPWDKDFIRFEVSIKVEANKQSKVDKTFENIEIDFSESTYYLIAQTVFDNKKSAFWSDVSDFTNSMLNGGSNAQIDYTVYIPSNNKLSLENKFGNIYMTDHLGYTLVNISNGDFRGGNFTRLDLDHSFGNVIIDSIQSGALTFGYTEFRLNYADNIRMTSKSSKCNIRHFSNIRLNSKRDTYHFKNAGMLNGETSFSYLSMENLNGDLILNTHYGDLSIDNFGKDFSFLNVVSNFTDVAMICRQGSGYQLEVYYDRKTEMVYPQNKASLKSKEIDSDEGKYLLSGNSGPAGTDNPLIKLNINGGSFHLVHH
jgi:hypothetical protein